MGDGSSLVRRNVHRLLRVPPTVSSASEVVGGIAVVATASSFESVAVPFALRSGSAIMSSSRPMRCHWAGATAVSMTAIVAACFITGLVMNRKDPRSGLITRILAD